LRRKKIFSLLHLAGFFLHNSASPKHPLAGPKINNDKKTFKIWKKPIKTYIFAVDVRKGINAKE
jgi:hypothetical protein